MAILVKDDLWFALHRRLLVKLANTQEGRDVLNLDRHLQVLEVGKHWVAYGDGYERRYEFRTHAPIGDLIRERWADFAPALHSVYDPHNRGELAELWTPSGKLLAATIWTFIPDPHIEVDSMDGYAFRFSADDTFVSFTTGAGSSAFANDNTVDMKIISDGTPNTYQTMYRGFLVFDTSPLPTAAIKEAWLTLNVTNRSNPLAWNTTTQHAMALVGHFVVSHTNLVSSDYQRVLAVRLAPDALGSSQGVLQTYQLNELGMAAISKTDVTKLATRFVADLDNNPGAWIADKTNLFIYRARENAGGVPTAPALNVLVPERGTGSHGQVKDFLDIASGESMGAYSRRVFHT